MLACPDAFTGLKGLSLVIACPACTEPQAHVMLMQDPSVCHTCPAVSHRRARGTNGDDLGQAARFGFWRWGEHFCLPASALTFQMTTFFRLIQHGKDGPHQITRGLLAEFNRHTSA